MRFPFHLLPLFFAFACALPHATPAPGALEQALGRYGKDAGPGEVAARRLSRGMALRRAGSYQRAMPDLDAARVFFQTEDNLPVLETIQQERALALAGLGDWRAAFDARGEYEQLHQQMQDRLLDERSARTQQHALRSEAMVRQWQLAVLVLALIAMAALAVLAARQMRLCRTLRDLAMTDELTRLPNRRHLMALAEGALSHAQSSQGALAVAALDIDFFKKVNDSYGHAAGDLLLQRVAHALRVALRPGDTVGRIGGEEFIALLRGADQADAHAVAERLRAAVETLDCSDIAPTLRPTISVGVAVRAPTLDKLDLLCKRADDALYRAKKRGRNRVEAWIAAAA